MAIAARNIRIVRRDGSTLKAGHLFDAPAQRHAIKRKYVKNSETGDVQAIYSKQG